MKTHVKNLLLASLVYLAAFIGVVIAAMVSDIGIFLFDEEIQDLDPDTVIFIASVFFIFLASFAAYFVFYLIQRNKAKNDPNAQYLRLFPRIVGAIIACALSLVVAFLCLGWISFDGGISSILYENTTLFGIIIGVVVIVNFVNFIVFKPRV